MSGAAPGLGPGRHRDYAAWLGSVWIRVASIVSTLVMVMVIVHLLWSLSIEDVPKCSATVFQAIPSVSRAPAPRPVPSHQAPPDTSQARHDTSDVDARHDNRPAPLA